MDVKNNCIFIFSSKNIFSIRARKLFGYIDFKQQSHYLTNCLVTYLRNASILEKLFSRCVFSKDISVINLMGVHAL